MWRTRLLAGLLVVVGASFLFQSATAQISAKFFLVVDTFHVSLAREFNESLTSAMSGDNDERTLSSSVFVFPSLTESPPSLQPGSDSGVLVEDPAYLAVCREFSSNLTLIIDATAAGWPRLRLSADALGIPYFRIEASMAPFARAAASYALKLNASDAALIFQNEAELEQGLSALIGQTSLRVSVHNRLPNETINLLKSVRPWPDSFIIIADTANMGALIKAAAGSELITQDQQWMLVLLNFPTSGPGSSADWMEELPRAVAELRPSVPEMCCPLLGFTAGCECNKSLAHQIVPNFLTRLANFLADLVVNGGSDLAAPRPFECGVFLKGDDEAAIAARKDTFDHLIAQVLPRHPSLLYDPNTRILNYRVAMEVSVIRARSAGRLLLGSWSADRGLVVAAGRQVSGARGLQRVGMIEQEPWSRYDNVSGVWSGYCVELANKIATEMDFDLEFIKPNPFGLGEKKTSDDGMVTWNGLTEMLRKGDIDMIVAPIAMTSEREEIIDFIIPYFDTTGFSIMVRQPVQTTSMFKFMSVLRTEVWISLLGALFGTGLMLYIIERVSPYSFRNDPKRYPYPCRDFTPKEAFWFAFTSFTPQGGGEVPKSISARVLVAAYWLFVVLMLATFTANLAAYLTVERLQVQVTSLEQLARQSRVQYGVVPNSPAHTYFKNMRIAEIVMYRAWLNVTFNQASYLAPNSMEAELAAEGHANYRVWNYPIKEMYNIINDNLVTNFQNPEQGLQKVLASEDGSFAFIHDSSWIKYQVSRSCDLAEVGEVFGEQPYAVAVSPGHPLGPDISRKLLVLQRDRYFEELHARYWNNSFRATCPFISDGEGISLESIGGVFIATLCGLLIAVVTLGLEIVYTAVRTRRRENRAKQQQEQEAKEKGEGLPDLYREQPPIPKPFLPSKVPRKRRPSQRLSGQPLQNLRSEQVPRPRISFIN